MSTKNTSYIKVLIKEAKMSISITQYFITSLLQLDKRIQKATLAAISSIENSVHSDSLKIHKLEKVKCDPKFRSARVNDDVRIIFANRDHGDKALLYVDHHEAAYKWCEGKYLTKSGFGAEMIYDEVKASQSESLLQTSLDLAFLSPTTSPLLEKHNLKSKHLIKLGITEEQANKLMSISDEDVFLEYIQFFSEELQEALLSLASGEKAIDEVLNELTDDEYSRGETLEQKDTKRRFHMLQSLDELEAILKNGDFEAWTVFLHPSQEKLVKMNYKGPALIEGGPGTGKTIVGIHRAVYLSENIYKPGDGKRILFCTFSKKLAKNIQNKIKILSKMHGIKENNIDVSSVDSYLYRLYKTAYNRNPNIKNNEINNLFDAVYRQLSPAGSLSFYRFEYQEIIEKFRITSLQQYLALNRTGGTIPLSQKQRVIVWRFFEEFLREKQRLKLESFVDVANAVNDALRTNRCPRIYDSIVIDEAQDLELTKLKALTQSVKATTNNILILSDVNQRIFKLTSWKRDIGIKIVGRTYYLFINYRTTKQISDYARQQFMNSEIVTEHIREYKSIINGIPPQILSFTTETEQRKYIVKEIKKLITSCPSEQICIICPTIIDCTAVSSVLEYEDIKCCVLEKDLLPENNSGINICPINGVKGLEFRIVIIYNYNRIDETHIIDSQNELIKGNQIKLAECAKYVASTRARDELIITYIEKVT